MIPNRNKKKSLESKMNKLIKEEERLSNQLKNIQEHS